jgi:hypothetical protein
MTDSGDARFRGVVPLILAVVVTACATAMYNTTPDARPPEAGPAIPYTWTTPLTPGIPSATR